MANSNEGFSSAEREAMAQRAAELRANKGLKGAARREREFTACIEAIDALTGTDRIVASRFHVIVGEEAPQLEPRTWYGFPAYAHDGSVITFVQPSSKFDTRYATIGFNQDATLDDGPMWATSFAVVEMTPDVEDQLRELVRRATS